MSLKFFVAAGLLFAFLGGMDNAKAAEIVLTECPHHSPGNPRDALRMAYVHEFADFTAIKPEIVFKDALGNLHQITDVYAYSRESYTDAKIFCLYESDQKLTLPVQGRLTQCGRVSKPADTGPEIPGRIIGAIAFWCSGIVGR